MSYLLAFLIILFSHTVVHANEVQEAGIVLNNAPETLVQLTPVEQKWLAAHKNIRVAYDGSLPPYSFVNDEGKIDGIAVEIMALLSERLGVSFTIYPNTNWNKLYTAAAKRKVDVVATMVDRPDRVEWFKFTKPYLTKSLVIITKEDNTTIKNRDDLEGKKIAVVEGYQYGEQVAKEFPTIKRVKVKTMLDSLKEVGSGGVDAAIIFVGTANYLQEKYKLDHLKGDVFYDRNSANESIAVRKDWPILVEILQKALDSLTEEKIQKIFAKWIVTGTPVTEPVIGVKPVETKPVEATPIVEPKPSPTAKIAAPIPTDDLKSPDEALESDEKISKTQIAAVLSGMLLILFMLLMLTRKRKKLHVIPRSERMSPIINLPPIEKDDEPLTVAHPVGSIGEDQFVQTSSPSDEYIYYRHDIEGKFTYVSPSVNNLLNYTEDDFMANYRHYLTDNPANRHIDEYIESCLKGQPNEPYKIEIVDAKGDKHWLEIMDTPVYDGQGHCIGVEGVMHDITGHRFSDDQPANSPEPQVLAEEAHPKTLLEYLQSAIQLANQSHRSFALIYLSLDRLRFLDGTTPPPPEIEVLDEANTRLRTSIRDTDTVVQLEANKFALILSETDSDKIGVIVEKIKKNLLTPYVIGVQSIALDANLSIAVYPKNGTDPESLINQAKASLPHEPLEPNATTPSLVEEGIEAGETDSLLLQQELVAALDECKISLRSANLDNINALQRHSPFTVYYHSRHNLSDYSITGFEALVRWEHPHLGLVLPAVFVPLVNGIGLLDVMTYWIIQQVCLQAVIWEKQGIRPGLISINLGDLAVKKIIEVTQIMDIINDAGAKPEWLTFSIPESEVTANPELVIPIINQLVADGLVVSIDNFSSNSPLLGLLKTIPARIIEIDPAFVRNLPNNTTDAETITYSISMLHELGKKVLAKGIETEGQMEFLKAIGCDMVQGHLLSKPLPAKDTKGLIESFPDVAWYFQQK
jgi:PAS domain S-box-containing protein